MTETAPSAWRREKCWKKSRRVHVPKASFGCYVLWEVSCDLRVCRHLSTQDALEPLLCTHSTEFLSRPAGGARTRGGFCHTPLPGGRAAGRCGELNRLSRPSSPRRPHPCPHRPLLARISRSRKYDAVRAGVGGVPTRLRAVRLPVTGRFVTGRSWRWDSRSIGAKKAPARGYPPRRRPAVCRSVRFEARQPTPARPRSCPRCSPAPRRSPGSRPIWASCTGSRNGCPSCYRPRTGRGSGRSSGRGPGCSR